MLTSSLFLFSVHPLYIARTLFTIFLSSSGATYYHVSFLISIIGTLCKSTGCPKVELISWFSAIHLYSIFHTQPRMVRTCVRVDSARSIYSSGQTTEWAECRECIIFSDAKSKHSTKKKKRITFLVIRNIKQRPFISTQLSLWIGFHIWYHPKLFYIHNARQKNLQLRVLCKICKMF